MGRKSTDVKKDAEPEQRRARAAIGGPRPPGRRHDCMSPSLRRAAEEESEHEKEKWIGDHLRKAYDDILKEPVPDRLAQLLRELEKRERSSK